MSNQRWICTRCIQEVIDKRCGCTTSPSPWMPVGENDVECSLKSLRGMKCYREGWRFNYDTPRKYDDRGNEPSEQFYARHKAKDDACPYPEGSFERSEWMSGWIDCNMGTGRE